MIDSILQKLLATDDAAEKAAIVAEIVFDELPKEIALVARRCVILHWFDKSIIEALLQGTSLTESDAKEVYDQFTTLPFIESLAWGLTFHDLTREGLLKRYAIDQQDLLKTAASLAAPAYKAREENETIAAEAFFCYTVANNPVPAMELLDRLLEQAASRENWQYINSLWQLQDEAERLLFVQSLPLTEKQWMFRAFVHRVQGQLEAAIIDYGEAIKINPSNVLAYISRGTAYAEQQRDEDALLEFDHALLIDPTIAQAFINRAIIYSRQHRYKAAKDNISQALHLGLPDAELYSSEVKQVITELLDHTEVFPNEVAAAQQNVLNRNLNSTIPSDTIIDRDHVLRNAIDMPFSQSSLYRETSPIEAEPSSSDKLDTRLRLDNILHEEFSYASLTAYQAMEDRTRLSNLYYLLLVALISVLAIAYQLGGNAHNFSQSIVVALLTIFGIISFTIFEKIIRSRNSYRESLICMNVIKEFYIKQLQQHMPQIDHAFRWRLKTIPPGERIGSVTFTISALIAFMDSFCLAGAVLVGIKPDIIVNPGGAGVQTYLIPLVVFVIVLLIHIWYYRRALSKRREAAILESQAREIGIYLPSSERIAATNR